MKIYANVLYDEAVEKDAIYDVEKVEKDCFLVKTSSDELIEAPEDFLTYLYKDMIDKGDVASDDVVFLKAGELYQVLSADPADSSDISSIEEKFKWIEKTFVNA